jgi:hypothetical protein
MRITMSFSYSKSMKAWDPEVTKNDPKIRIMELLPPPWYLRWLPRIIMFLVPLRSNLVWAPLMKFGPSGAVEVHPPETEREPPSYKALPYTWGNPDLARDFLLAGQKLSIPPLLALYYFHVRPKSKDILINRQRFQITPSLALALFHLRPDAQPLQIWIDQICINQEDYDEKSEQVGHMEHIYRNCEETFVWLGPLADGSDALMDLFNRMGEFAENINLLDLYQKTG